MSFVPTDEQNEIFQYIPSPGEIIKVIAYAGTGKTTTLFEMAKIIKERSPESSVLYIAYNKAIQIEASRKFGIHAEARTIHSLAFAAIKPSNTNEIRPFDLRKIGLKHDFSILKLACDAVLRFFNSNDLEVQLKHVKLDKYTGTYVSEKEILDIARVAWKDLSSEDGSLPISHDCYLKKWQLIKPKLDYDYVFFDEAQDSNPCTTDIVMNQLQFGTIVYMVGDPHQEIYGFRGAVSALDIPEVSKTFFLSTSFRFGEKTAGLSNKLLKAFKELKVDIKGSNVNNTLGSVNNNKQFTIICRRNSTIFSHALLLHLSHKIHFIGGYESYNFELINDIYKLSLPKSDRRFKNLWLNTFSSYTSFVSYAKSANEIDLQILCRYIEQFGDKVPAIIESIKNHSVAHEEQADICISTAHRSKGREWDQVYLSNDYEQLVKNGEFFVEDIQEVNLIYVAATRAKQHLKPCNSFKPFMNDESIVDKALYDKTKLGKLSFLGQGIENL